MTVKSERNQTQKAKCCKILFLLSAGKGKANGGRKQISGCWGLPVRRGQTAKGCRGTFGGMEMYISIVVTVGNYTHLSKIIKKHT